MAFNRRRRRIYKSWQSMKYRCLNPDSSNFRHYGGRGISISPEWLDFENFLNWAEANGYGDNLTLDRIDVNRGYCSDNCRWVTIREQNRNKRTNLRTSTGVLYIDCYRLAYKPMVKECAFRNRINRGFKLCESLYSTDASHCYNGTSWRAIYRNAHNPSVVYSAFLKRVQNGVPVCKALWSTSL